MTHYEVLGVEPGAARPELREAYLVAARRHHPDRGGDAEQMRAVTEAWAVLGDPQRRAAYDARLRGDGLHSATVHGAAGDGTGWPDGAATTDADDAHDLWDDRPLSDARPPGWLAIVPVAAFAASMAMFALGLVLGAVSLLATAFVTFVAACAMFVLMPFLVLAGARLSGRRQHRR